MNEKLKRPIGVWIIFVITVLMYLLTSINFLIVYDIIPISISFEQEFSMLSPIMLVKTLIMSIIFFYATLNLFQLKLITVKIYLIYFVLYLLNKVYFYFNPIQLDNQSLIVEDTVSMASFIGTIVTILIILYSVWLKKKGILKA